MKAVLFVRGKHVGVIGITECDLKAPDVEVTISGSATIIAQPDELSEIWIGMTAAQAFETVIAHRLSELVDDMTRLFSMYMQSDADMLSFIDKRQVPEKEYLVDEEEWKKEIRRAAIHQAGAAIFRTWSSQHPRNALVKLWP